MTSTWHGHNQEREINVGHTFVSQNQTSEFVQRTVFGTDAAQEAQWLRQHYEFLDTDRNLYVVPTHGGIDIIAQAWPDAKFIDIVYTDQDIDQMCYNWASKLVANMHPWQRRRVLGNHLRENLDNIKQKYNKLHWLDHSTEIDDFRLIVYILKFGWWDYFMALRNGSPQQPTDCVINVNFSDIASGQLVEQLDNIIEFIGLDVCESHRSNCLDLINRYAQTQKSVPWDLSLDLYH